VTAANKRCANSSPLAILIASKGATDRVDWGASVKHSTIVFVVVAFVTADVSAESVFSIGNSLTWDAMPYALDGDVGWHVTCNKNLEYIFDHPESYCLGSSTPWPRAFADNKYDYVTVQPFTGTTLEQDSEIISTWMEQQPDATFVIHTGWASVTALVPTYELANLDDQMRHSLAYFRDLSEAISVRFPDRDIGSTHMVDLLYVIARDIQFGSGPFESLEELFRDSSHLEHQGQYLAHNALRYVLGQPFRTEGFDIRPEVAEYLNAKIVSIEHVIPKLDAMLHPEPGEKAGPVFLTAVPEPDAIALCLAAGLCWWRKRPRKETGGS
jgi:hypothetical protein